MNKVQKLNFTSIEQFFDYIPSEERKLVELLRTLIFECIPDCREKLAYNVPFYYKHYRLCYLWPASIPWGGIKNGVSMGFCRANEMVIDTDHFTFGKKNVIASRSFTSVKDINPRQLESLLYEASRADEAAAKAKRKNP